MRKAAQNTTESGIKVGKAGADGSRIDDTDEVAPPGFELLATHRFAQPAPNPIAIDRPTDALGHGIGHARGFTGRAENRCPHLEHPRTAAAPTGQGPERFGVTYAPDQAESLARPLPRRRAINFRPARERMRRRNPWVFLRLRVFGWNVLFTHGLLGADRPEVGDRVGAGNSSRRR